MLGAVTVLLELRQQVASLQGRLSQEGVEVQARLPEPVEIEALAKPLTDAAASPRHAAYSAAQNAKDTPSPDPAARARDRADQVPLRR